MRDHAVKLHNISLLEELRDIRQEDGLCDEGAIKTRRSRAQVKLNKLKPGSCSSIGASKGRDGNIISDPNFIIGELRAYWGDIFPGGSCNSPC